MMNMMMGRVRVDERPGRQSLVAPQATAMISVNEREPPGEPPGTSRTTLGKLVDNPLPIALLCGLSSLRAITESK